MSGLAQVMCIDMRDPERLAVVDAEYVALRCLMLDGWIALRTLALLLAAVSSRRRQGEP